MKFEPIAEQSARPVANMLAMDFDVKKDCMGCPDCKGVCMALLEAMIAPEVVTRRAVR